jgi:hypothetical protein
VTPLPCHRCGTVPGVDTNGYSFGVACDNCYDAAIDGATRYEYGSGITRSGAVKDWNERMEMLGPRTATAKESP